MVDSILPNSSKRAKPISGDFTLRFAPGQPTEDMVFDNIPDIIDYIRAQTDSAITVYIDLTAVGGSFTLPVRDDYDFRRVFLDGYFNLDGTIPRLIWPEGSRIVDDCDFIRKRDVDFQIEATSTIIWTPNSSTRVEDERAAGYIQNGTVPFMDYTSSSSSIFTYSGGPGTGTEQFGGGPLFRIAAGQTFRAFLDADTRLNLDSVEGPVGSFMDLRYHIISFVDDQPSFLGTKTKSAFNQTGTTFPPEVYPAKLFLKQPENRYYFRSQTETAWVQLAIPPSIYHEDSVAGTTNIWLPYLSGSYNFESVRPHKISVSFVWASTNTAKDIWVRMNIGGVFLGRSDGVNTLIHKQQPRKAGSPPNWGQLLSVTYETEFTPVSTGSHSFLLEFRTEDNTGTSYFSEATVEFEEAI